MTAVTGRLRRGVVGERFSLSSKADERHHRPLDLYELLRHQSADSGMDIRPPDRRPDGSTVVLERQ